MANKEGLIAWFVENPVAANLLMIFLIIAGLVTAVQIRKEAYPDIATESVSINITYPGASPEDVEEGIAKKVEDSLQGLEGIRKINAVSYEGFASITVNAETGTKMDRFLYEIRSRINSIDTFPKEAEKPVIKEEIFKTEVLWLVLYGSLDDRNMKTLARQVRDDIILNTGVSQISIDGTKRFEISINISKESLKRFGLTFDTVATAVSSQSVDLPSGSIKTEGENISIRSGGKVKTGIEFENIIIKTSPDGTKIRVKDVATVIDGFAEEDWFLKYNGKKAVALQIFRTKNESTLSVAKAVKEYVSKNKNLLPPGVKFDIMLDMSVPLTERLELMLKNMAFGSVLVFITLALFLRVRIAFWVMMGLPVSFLGALWLMPLPFVDATVNMITLYGFILVLGILVDDAIVIGESIHESVDKEGPGISSVIQGVKAVATPATFGVLTTVAAFVPMITISGVNGKMFSGIGYVVILCLLFSLLESKLILPAHLRNLGKKQQVKRSPLDKVQDKISKYLECFLDRIYRPLLNRCMYHRYATIAAFSGVLILTMMCVKVGIVRFVFFPEIESDVIEVELTMSRGTPKKFLLEALEKVENAGILVNDGFIKNGEKEPPLKHYISYSESDNTARIMVELSPNDIRNVSTSVIGKEWRRLTENVRNMPGVKSLKFNLSFGESAGSPIDFEITGRSIENLEKVANELKKALSGFEGVSDIRDTKSEGKTEIKLSIKPGTESVGISLLDVARQARQAFYGVNAQTIQRGPDEVNVFVRYPKNERSEILDLESMLIRTTDGKSVPLTAVADVSLGIGPAEIIRKDRKRLVSVRADVDKKSTTPGEIIDHILVNNIPNLEEKYPGIKIKTAGESEEEDISMGSIQKSAFLALFAIFAMIAIPLKSYVRPLIIMTAIPFGIVGAILGHLFLGLPVSLLSLCGIIALSGVVVNDSLLMVDYITQRIEEGYDIKEAVSSSGMRRFRAILLTSISTFFGLLPMIMEKSLQAQYLIPMAVSLAFGILFSTFITLFLIPTLYLVWNDWTEFIHSDSSLKPSR